MSHTDIPLDSFCLLWQWELHRVVFSITETPLNSVVVVSLATRGQSGFKSQPICIVVDRTNAWTELCRETVMHLFLYWV